jgi:hypothetical protein
MTTRTRRRAVSAGTAAFVAGAAVAVLQVLQQTVGAFDPRPVISALIVLAAFFAGLAAGRMRSRRSARDALDARRRRLCDLVGVWPAPRTRDADPMRLGVFPADRAVGHDPPYVTRRLDADLRAAIVPGAVVLVFGDPRAGASRTALQAAGSVLPDAPVLAPRTPEALCELLAIDPPLQLGGRHALVWLDGLARYAEVLDAECLDALDALAERVTVVATIRRAEWDAWLCASGAAGEAARAVVARARVFELPALLDDGELAEAQRLYPERELSAGIGVAVASDGRDSAPPGPERDEPRGEDEPDPVPRAHRDPQLVGPASATFATLIVLLAVWALSGFSTPSIGDQLASIQRKGSSNERHAVVLGTADLHGSGERSHVLLFLDNPGTRNPRSDELRIYDEHGDKLVRALRFRPAGPRAVFQYRATTDVDFDGAAEIVGGFGYAGKAREAMVPFAIDWDHGAGRYRVVALDLGPPTLSRKPAIVAEAQYRDVYAAPTQFTDPADHIELTGHRVQDFIVSSPPRRLVAGWFLHPWIASEKATFELHTAIFDSSRGVPHLRPCTLTGAGPLVVRAGRERSVMSVFEEAYTAANGGRFCSPDKSRG